MHERQLLVRLDHAIAERSLLKHPFYHQWQAGKLSREALQLYAREYYQHVRAFPEHLRALADRAPGDLCELVLENLAEEENPVLSHPKLWSNFASALGISEESLLDNNSLPTTQNLVRTYRDICTGCRPVEAVAALYAYEAQVPEVSTTKIEALRRHYGVSSPRGLAYFRVHQEADKAHREAWRGWLHGCAADGPENGAKASGRVRDNEIVATAHRALDALWGALDGIQGRTMEQGPPKVRRSADE
jgi:pyrroloquinoline-quinone synthase